MYLRPDEVAKVLENAGFERVYTVNEAYGYKKGKDYVYVNRESYMGRTALVIHPSKADKNFKSSMPTALIQTSNKYIEFPIYLAGASEECYGIAYGFSSRQMLLNFLDSLY